MGRDIAAAGLSPRACVASCSSVESGIRLISMPNAVPMSAASGSRRRGVLEPRRFSHENQEAEIMFGPFSAVLALLCLQCEGFV